MNKPTPFCKAVVEILQKARGRGVDGLQLRKALMAGGWGKRPAAVAMHLTKLAWKEEYVTGYCTDEGVRVFMLTSYGRDL